jgi:two-component system C4-dicarboxylate transport sensor histidine kinase DctB
MLRNLVKNSLNALKSGPRKGKISINLAVPSKFQSDILITVSDNGPGIAPELRSEIYKQGITSKPGHGLGLGLSLASSVAHSLGGALRLRTTDASGTTFVIDLPATTSPELENFDDDLIGLPIMESAESGVSALYSQNKEEEIE